MKHYLDSYYFRLQKLLWYFGYNIVIEFHKLSCFFTSSEAHYSLQNEIKEKKKFLIFYFNEYYNLAKFHSNREGTSQEVPL